MRDISGITTKPFIVQNYSPWMTYLLQIIYAYIYFFIFVQLASKVTTYVGLTYRPKAII